MTRQEFEKRVMVIAGSPGCKVPDEAREWIDATLKVAAEMRCYWCGGTGGNRDYDQEAKRNDADWTLPEMVGKWVHFRLNEWDYKTRLKHLPVVCEAGELRDLISPPLRHDLNEGRR